jgi:peptidyl-prolyl cis-trans isomerase B (cyclophilin B)
VESFLRSALQDRERNARIAAARLLKTGGRTDVPEDPGPSATNATDLAYIEVASARQDRTIAIMDTARGRIEIELFREDAPLTVANFVSLAQRGFFDGLSFMRVVPYFVIQGGDPRNDQEGGPGYTIRCEINMHPFERGALGMALAGKDTGGSQFFITLSPQPHLDGGYTCFGRVVSGMPAAEHMVAGDRILSVRVKEEITLFDYRRY